MCSECKISKRLPEDFHVHSRGTDGVKKYRYECKECWKRSSAERSKEHYKKNPGYYRARNQRNRVEGAAFLREAKNKPCLDCGGSFPFYAMQFDHVRGKKYRNLAQMHGSTRSVVLREIAKCDLVCANCHAIRTYLRKHG